MIQVNQAVRFHITLTPTTAMLANITVVVTESARSSRPQAASIGI